MSSSPQVRLDEFLREEEQLEARRWPKGQCAGFWASKFRTSVGSGKGSRTKRAVTMPTSMYGTKGTGWVGSAVFTANMRVGSQVRSVVGTLRADSCAYFTHKKEGFEDGMCPGCSRLPEERSFKEALGHALRMGGDVPLLTCVDDYSPK